MTPAPTTPPVTVASIVSLVSYELGLAPSDVVGICKEDRLVRGRTAVCWLARKATRQSLQQIGRVIRRDHSTVHEALRRAEALRARDPAFRAVTDKLADRLQRQAGQ